MTFYCLRFVGGREKSSGRPIKNRRPHRGDPVPRRALPRLRMCSCPPPATPPLSPLRALRIARVDVGLIRALPFLIVASLSSSVIVSAPQYTLWPLPYEQPLPAFHTCRHASTRKRAPKTPDTCNVLAKFPALRANWLQLSERDKWRKSKVMHEEERAQGGKRRPCRERISQRGLSGFH